MVVLIALLGDCLSGCFRKGDKLGAGHRNLSGHVEEGDSSQTLCMSNDGEFLDQWWNNSSDSICK